ncbi:NAD(P)/FAD-dependent oxidoreductase [Ideonella sp. BN130291]|uniref:NAD(P)/FAD-dependent oxidoreductase n=1 Tax=Ideonella sp. BN130291 TaxID=3112940 RepID=UPI002E25CF03|nr:NAD(P)/FAD-dependent oxidoreductase [Ideonella sp. BN130291]
MDTRDALDCLVVGAGPAGLTAGMYLRRFHRLVLVVDGGDARALRIPRSHNVPGFPQGIPGPELIDRLQQQYAEVGGHITRARVNQVLRRPEDGLFQVLVGGETVLAKTVLLATGALDHEPQMPGLADLRERGLLRQCPICDGFEFTGRCIGVIGAGAHGARESLFIRHFSERLWFIGTHGLEEVDGVLAARLHEAGVRCVQGRPVSADTTDNGRVRLCMDDGSEHHFDVLYAALGCHPRAELGTALGARRDHGGNLVIDHHCRTGIEGLYAAGDVTGGLDQIVVATGQAAIAATAIHNSL